MMFMNLSTSYCCIYTKMNQTLARVFWFSSLHTMHWSSNGSVYFLLVQPLKYIFFTGVLTLMKHFRLWRSQSLAERYIPLYFYHTIRYSFFLPILGSISGYVVPVARNNDNSNTLDYFMEFLFMLPPLFIRHTQISIFKINELWQKNAQESVYGEI